MYQKPQRKSDSELQEERRLRKSKRQQVFLSNLDPIWYIGAGFLTLGLAFKIFTLDSVEGSDVMMGGGALLLALASIFVGVFLFYNRGTESKDEDDDDGGIRHKLIPIALILATILTFIGLQIASAISVSASTLSPLNYTLESNSDTMYLASCEVSTCNASSTFVIQSQLSAGREFIAIPFLVGNSSGTIDTITFNCNSNCGNAGEFIRLGVYADDGTSHYPGTLCDDFGAIELNSGTGFYQITGGTCSIVSSSIIYWGIFQFEPVANYSGPAATFSAVSSGGSSTFPLGTQSVSDGGGTTNVYNNWGIAVPNNACDSTCSVSLPTTFPTLSPEKLSYNDMRFPSLWYELN